ncbi:M16 family metallopeptidase [Nocardia amamiensis]|uniref:M16 family metallopeptidase n=1 Tax=Nocardia TaxID=1817 RepID=UPI0033D85529
MEDQGGTVSAAREKEWLLLEMTATVDSVPMMLECCRAVLSGDIDDDTVMSAKRIVSARTTSLEHGPGDPALQADMNRWLACYGHVPPVMGLPAHKAVVESTAGDVRSASFDLFTSGAAHLVVVGDVDPARLIDDIEPVANVIRGTTRIETSTALVKHNEPRLITQSAPAFRRTSIRLAYPTPSADSQKQLLSRIVSAVILGGTPQSRLGRVFRDELGVAYDVSALTSRALDADCLLVNADIANESAQESVDRLYTLLSDFAGAGPTQQEIDDAIRFLNNTYDSAWSTLLGRAMFVVTYITSHLRLEDIRSVKEELSRLSIDDVTEFARMLRPELFYGAVSSGFHNLNVAWHVRRAS